MLAPARALFEFLLSRPYDEPLTWRNDIETARTGPVRSLFHGPPAMCR